MKITFWQNILSPHQSAFLDALAVHPQHSVTLVVDEHISDDRVGCGWSSSSPGNAKVVVAPDSNAVEVLLAQDSVHVISGFKLTPRLRSVAHSAARRKLRYGIITERPRIVGWKGHLNELLYQYERWLHGAEIDFILAMGTLGVDWFHRREFRPRHMFPFAYAVENALCSSGGVLPATSPFRFIYLGQLVPRKGVHLALRAMSECRSRADLLIVGTGPLEAELRKMVKDLGLESCVRFCGMCPNSVALRHLSGSDCLLLPSLFDGWGAAVNEALLLGVPVICSDACGAKDLVGEPWRGAVCKAGDGASLSLAMRRMLHQGKRDEVRSQRIRQWASAIEGGAIADYFIKILQCVYEGAAQPAPPWVSEGAVTECS